jgi:hypothetical protein
MEKKKRFRWDRLALCVYVACNLAFVVWVALSYFNIVLHNTEANPAYFTWNFFTTVF